jgi:hypothetical protein
MAKKVSRSVDLEFAFFTYLWQFYQENRRIIRQHYRDLTRRFLDFNDPANANSYLRQPQFEALEMYVFLKEYLDNEPVHQIFKEWMNKESVFQARNDAHSQAGQINFLEVLTKEQYEPVFERMRSNARVYSNYIYALTMGVGKTILMATCIFYEFILANKFPKDTKYCHNALVFAPDKTVLQSLREMQTFDMTQVVPPEYVNFLSTHIQYHFLDEAGAALSVLDKSSFNLIVSNTQKIILKRQNKDKSATDQLFGSGKPAYESNSVYEKNADLYGYEEPEDEETLTTNQRFEKLRRLEQLGIYVDEAHHAFGTALAKDMGVQQTDTSLRRTIDELAASLERSGTKVVACYNYTGTPYVGQEVLPEVVYAFGLQEAIEKQFLKKVDIKSYTNTKSAEFIQIVVDDFVQQGFYQQHHEGMLPKIAFFASTIDELQKELRPAVEKALAKHNIPSTSILVNVGDEKLTTNDDIREFNHLDTVGSTKQFILLVNKGREGWNCRSLFGVALFREPKSKIFVLQATMRCLRSIGLAQQTGQVYLSAENRQILDDELRQNFRISVDDLSSKGKDKNIYEVRVVPPPVKIKLQRIRRQFEMKEKDLKPGFSLELDKADTEKYRIIQTEEHSLGVSGQNQSITTDLTDRREKRIFSRITLVAEISCYLNKPCLQIESILDATTEGIEKILDAANGFNELLYDWIIPRLFNELYDISKHDKSEEYEVELVKLPKEGFYQLSASPNLVVRQNDAEKRYAEKSFHLDTYCFDSDPERNLFWNLLRDGKVKKLYFTGMLTNGQTDFYVQYIDPESHTVRSYYPDFLVQKEDGSYIIVEVKGDNKIEDPVVLAKQEFAEQMAAASGMTYKIIKGSDAAQGRYAFLLGNDPMPYVTGMV